MADKRWHRDELILALDLYFRLPHGQFDKKNEDVKALSKALQALPVNADRAEGDNFRSPNSVAMKLSNFSAIDPVFPGKGLESYSQKDVAIWNEFHDKHEELEKLTAEIKSGSPTKPLSNPNWTKEEIILGLETYWRLGYENLRSNHPGIIQLSQQLNALNIHSFERRAETFRSPMGITKVLQLFHQIETNAYNKIKPGKLAIQLYQQYDNDGEALHKRVEEILRRTEPSIQKESVPYDMDSGTVSEVQEGNPIYRRHIQYERNYGLIRDKKKAFKQLHGHLACEACGFNFEDKYGTLGENFIECHHLRPLSEYIEDRTTTHDDLALLCANCHRMIHKLDNLGLHSVEELKKILGK